MQLFSARLRTRPKILSMLHPSESTCYLLGARTNVARLGRPGSPHQCIYSHHIGLHWAQPPLQTQTEWQRFLGITGMDWTNNFHQEDLELRAVFSIVKAFISNRLN